MTELKSLHVLFTGLVTPDMVSGGDQLFLDIAPRLPKSLKIVVVTPEFSKELWKSVNQENIEFRFLPTNLFDFKGNPVAIFASYIIRSWQTYQLLKKEKIEVIYSCSDIAYADIWPAYFLSKNKKVRWISRIYHVLLSPNRRQGGFLNNLGAYYLQKLSFWMMKKRSDHILALNQKLYDEVVALGFPKNKLGILGAGIDFAKINSFKKTKDYDYDVVVLGRIAPVKGIFDTIKMWEKVHLRNQSWKLAWIGGGNENYVNKMTEMIKERNFGESFERLGFLEKEEVYNILKSAKVFLCPDHENGWGLAVSEAMSSGLPVVSYDIDIFGSVYKKGFRSVPLFDTDRFADQLIEVLEDGGLRKKLGEEAVEQAKEFDHEKVVKDLIKIIS